MKEPKIYSYIFTLLILVSVAPAAVAQQEDDVRMKPVEIEIVKEREITLPQANRLFDKIPPRPVEPIKPEITYNFRPLTFTTPESNPAIRPLRLKQEDSKAVNGGFVSAGYGNYASPYLEAFVNSKENKNKLIGAHAFLNSSGKGPVDGKNSGSGNSGLSVFAQTFSKEFAFQGNAGFENLSTHFYGYPEGENVLRDTIRQSYNLFTIGLGITNARNTDFSYNLGGNFSFLNDKFEASESTVDLNFSSAYKIGNDNAIELKAFYTLINRKDEGIDKKARNLFQVNPYYSFRTQDNLKLQVGAVLAVENDTLDAKNLHLYPDVKVTYPLTPSIDVVGTLTGGIERVSLQTLMRQNRWLNAAIPIYHTNKVFDFQAALNMRLNSNVFVNTGLSFASLKNLYFFVNNDDNQAKFDMVYDEGATKRTNLFASMNMNYGNTARLSLRGDYFSYNTGSQAEAWHRPAYSLTLGGRYNLKGKLAFSSDILALGGIKALDPVTLQSVKLDPAFDLNFRVEYFVSDKFSVFVDLNNITSNAYQVYFNYPVRAFQAMGGITWSF
ncbi:MAG: hypothetical protein KF725_13900 [Cyclobacteriaceae bacterium]|nr:hypothetical protein [Cyclobacteriaceae bacterium]UYN85288.1 MAG: hypothetical protein KIT51_10310 [Cyclobacteriaceae bacterium]